MSYPAGEIILDKYRIESLLGQGAFGEVYLVTHLTLRVPRAIKVLRRDAPGVGSSLYGDAQARFQLEAQLGARLHQPDPNPHLLQVYDFIQREDLLVLEMEYAPGGSLLARLEKQKKEKTAFPLEEALRIAEEVAEGLGALHSSDLVHRDVKPGNILFDERGRARLADLGLAQVPGGPSLRSQLSEPAPHPGTPGYMSPEQENSGSLLKPPSDVYSLGVVLFEMLTGRNYALLKPGTRAKSLRVDLPAGVDELLVRMLAKNPEERPWDGAETTGLLRQVNQAGQAAARLKAEGAEKLRAETLERERRERDELARKNAEAAERKRQAEIKERERREREELERKSAEATERARQARSGEQAKSRPGMLRYWPAGLVVIAVALLAYLGGRGGFGAAQSLPTRTESPTLAASPVPVLGKVSTQTRAKDGMVEVYVPAGSFTMGSNDGSADEKPAHTVDLPAYWIDQTDVTNAMFAKFASEQGYTTDAEKNGSGWAYDKSTSSWSDVKGADWQHPSGPGSSRGGLENHPVVLVSWNDAAAYCAWAGPVSGAQVRLPTEAEWEKAARGENGQKYPWGDQEPTGELANFGGNVGSTSPVGNYPKGASPYGALDMAGNVWQWTADWYDVYPGGDPKASSDFGTTARVLRGGSWYLNGGILRASIRLGFGPSFTYGFFGFRCARSN